MTQDTGSFRERLLAAIAASVPGHDRPLLPGRAAAVLVLFKDVSGEDPSLLLTRRTERLETHKGQIAFPGGAVDPEDESAIAAALRETEEEVGLPRDEIEALGPLPRLWTPSGFVITPVVGVLRSPDEVLLKPNPHEIADVFWAPLSQLRDPATYRLEEYPHENRMYPIHVYQVGAHRVWGATAAVIKNLFDRLDRIEQSVPTERKEV